MVATTVRKCEIAENITFRFLPVIEKNAMLLHEFRIRFTVLTNEACIASYLKRVGLNAVQYATTNMTLQCWEKFHHAWCLKRDALRYMTSLDGHLVFIDADFLITSCHFPSLFKLQATDFHFAAAPQHASARRLDMWNVRFNSGLFVMNAAHFSEHHFRRHFECWDEGDQICLSKYITRYHDYVILPMYTHCRYATSDTSCLGNHRKSVLQPEVARALFHKRTRRETARNGGSFLC